MNKYCTLFNLWAYVTLLTIAVILGLNIWTISSIQNSIDVNTTTEFDNAAEIHELKTQIKNILLFQEIMLKIEERKVERFNVMEGKIKILENNTHSHRKIGQSPGLKEA